MSGKSERLRTSQILAGALAAVTAALLGSTMGVAGTVLGAGLASVVTTVGSALYLRSIQRTGRRVLVVRERVAARAGTGVVPRKVDGTEQLDEQTDEQLDDEPAAAGKSAAGADRPPAGRRRWPTMVAGAVLAFLLGMLVVTGLELVRGEPLSGGDGTTVGDLVRADPGDHDRGVPPATEDSTPPSKPTTPPTTTEAPTEPTTQSEPTTTTTSPPPTRSSVTPSGPPSTPPSSTGADAK